MSPASSPPQFLARVADGRLPGSSAQVSAADRQETLVCTLEEAGGRDGKSLCSHKTTLADIIDFGAAAAVPVDVCRERLGPAFVATFLESQYQRGLQEKSANLASSALASLRFLAEHCGLDAPDLHCKQVTSRARPSVLGDAAPPARNPAGVVPAWLVYRLGLLAQGEHSSLQYFYTLGMRPQEWSIVIHFARLFVIGLICGLRMVELEAAYLVPEEDPRVVAVKYPPKGDPKSEHAHHLGLRPRHARPPHVVACL